MHKILSAVIAVLVFVVAGMAQEVEKKTAKNPRLGQIRHVVIFKFKDGTKPEQVDNIVKEFGKLATKIPTIVDYEWGTNVSPENLANGFTHCFLVTFKNAADRDAYLPHPAHKAFVQVLRPHLEKAFVMDYVAKE